MTEAPKAVINPLGIRFSQPRINPSFADGSTFEDAIAVSSYAPCVIDSSPGTCSEQLLLHPPFPPIEVIRWRPKLRDPSGAAKLDSKTRAPLKGEEHWFTMD